MPKLLIVDDETDVREFAANFFRKRKMECFTASSGEEAIELTDKEKPDLVLLDIKMDGIDGIETLKRIREKNSTLKVIMVTGRKPDDQEAFNKCKDYGATDYIHKPLELDELEKIVMAQLNKS
ncbi:MAG: response regulator [Candidatus Omnitrophica bacterium]|nr:response regulator [Candidatus Omnitrophota bacterium]